MFYILLLTNTVLCLTTNKLLPGIFKEHLDKAKTFDSLEDAEIYLHTILTYDDFWAFGLMHIENGIELGKVYYRY